MSHSVVAIITARGASKGLPRKNVRTLCGKPLIAYSILAARGCPQVSRCIVTTDDPEIKRISLQWGAEVVDRPAELATDTALSRDAVRHVLELLSREGGMPEYFVLLQPTSPLRTARHLERCLEAWFASGRPCAISVTEAEHHPYKCFLLENGDLAPLRDSENLDQPRQSLPPAYRQNGAIYLLKTAEFLSSNSFFIAPALPFVMSRQESIDIDTEHDLRLAEEIMKAEAAQGNEGE